MYANVEEVLARVQDVVEYSDIPLVDVNQPGIFGNTPLAVVTTWGDAEAARLLLEAGADVGAKIEDGDTVLHRAAGFGHADLVRLFLGVGASPDTKNDDGRTPRDMAKGNEAVSQLLLR